MILGTLEEARTKMYYANILTTLSVNRVNGEHKSTDVTRKKLENKLKQSSPRVKSSKAIILFLNRIVSWSEI